MPIIIFCSDQVRQAALVVPAFLFSLLHFVLLQPLCQPCILAHLQEHLQVFVVVLIVVLVKGRVALQLLALVTPLVCVVDEEDYEEPNEAPAEHEVDQAEQGHRQLDFSVELGDHRHLTPEPSLLLVLKRLVVQLG